MNHRTLLTAGLAAGALLLRTPAAGAGPAAEPRMLLHLVSTTSKAPDCAVPVAACADVRTFGIISAGSEQYYYGYILITGFDRERGLELARLAVDFDRTTGSGVDTFGWTLCASRQADGSDWYNGFSGNTLYWDDCPKTEFAVGGYFYMAAYDPSRMALIPPAGEDARIQNCGGAEVIVPPTRLGIASFTGDDGCNPCSEECNYVPVERSSWGGLKALYRGTAPGQ